MASKAELERLWVWCGNIAEELEEMRDEIAKLYEAETGEIINEVGATPPLFNENR